MFFSKWLKPKETPEAKEFRSNIIYGDQLIEKWEIDVHELSYVVLKKDLSILDLPEKFNSQSIYDPIYYKIDSNELLDIVQNSPSSLLNKAFWIPEVNKATYYVNSLIGKTNKQTHETSGSSSRIKYSEILVSQPNLKGKEREDRTQQPKEVPENNIKNIIEEHDYDLKINSFVFSLIGKVWFVKFKKTEWGLFPDHEKYKYIAYLLKQSEIEPNNLEYFLYNDYLISKIKGINTAYNDQNVNMEEDLSITYFSNDLTIEEISSIKEIGYRLLQKQIRAKNDHDSKKYRKTQEEFKKYQSYILNEYGMKSQVSKDGKKIYFSNYHRPSEENEKLRQLIKNQINNAVKDFKKSMPMLGTHLQNSVKPKLYKTFYTPEYSILWIISL